MKMEQEFLEFKLKHGELARELQASQVRLTQSERKEQWATQHLTTESEKLLAIEGKYLKLQHSRELDRDRQKETDAQLQRLEQELGHFQTLKGEMVQEFQTKIQAMLTYKKEVSLP